MKMSYSIFYRKSGGWRWKELKNVIGDGIEPGCRYFHTEDDELIFLPSNVYDFKYPKERQVIVTHKQSKTAGQPVQRA